MSAFPGNARFAPRLGWLICLVASIPFGANRVSAETFVIGYERFGRHGDLSHIEAGELLMSELNCTSCHPTSKERLPSKLAPSLVGIGRRVQADWLRGYLEDPAGVDPGTTMPNVLQHLPADERETAINGLVAFLSTQQLPFVELKAGGASPLIHEFWRRGDASRGMRLYHSVGCVACHAPDEDYDTPDASPSAIDRLIDQLDPEEVEELGLSGLARRVPSIPHGDLRQKLTLRSLTMFLMNPARTRPSGRMPNMRLAPDEAADIAAYLLDDQADDSTAMQVSEDVELIEQGKRWFTRLRCARCHTGMDVETSSPARELSDLRPQQASSCLREPSGEMPAFQLDDQQRDDIVARLMSSADDASKDADHTSKDLGRNVQLRMVQQNCLACHERAALPASPDVRVGGSSRNESALGGIGRYRKAYFETVGSVDLGDEGRLPPPLTGVGRKLTEKTLRQVFDAKSSTHRPYQMIRMPAYGEHAGVSELVSRIVQADRPDRRPVAEVFAKAKSVDLNTLLAAGRTLADTGCVQCHPFAGESLPGVVGIDLSEVTRRIHPAWFRAFIENPSRVKQRTRMPTFFPDGKSNSPHLLDGDVDAQIAALWHYLDRLPSQPRPSKIEQARAADYVLTPSDRPLILRTFMDDVGTHAIAVGFPSKIHYAWDSEHCRLAIGWKGKFLDARSTWFERFAPPVSPLGKDRVALTTEQVFFRTTDAEDGVPTTGTDASDRTAAITAAFLGYRLNADHVPTMLYRVAGWNVAETITPRRGGLVRTLAISAPGLRESNSASDRTTVAPEPHLNWTAFSGTTLEPLNANECKNSDGVTASILRPTTTETQTVRTKAGFDWRIGLTPPTVISVEYTW